jgi:hypothetical protein
MLIVLQVSCDECSNCEPFTEEPFVLVRFYNAADSSRRVLVIDSVNQTPTAGLRHFNDTTWEFRFPLNMLEDVSDFNLVARDTSQLDSIPDNHFIRFNYTRQFVRRDDNYIVSECNLISLETSFSGASLVCKEEDKCLSNDAKASFYQ